jgi:hypothetical protein
VPDCGVKLSSIVTECVLLSYSIQAENNDDPGTISPGIYSLCDACPKAKRPIPPMDVYGVSNDTVFPRRAIDNGGLRKVEVLVPLPFVKSSSVVPGMNPPEYI